MNKKANLTKARNIMIAVYFVFFLAMSAWAFQVYFAAKRSLAVLGGERAQLAHLNTEINSTHSSIERLKAEQREFKKLLFNDRDVPAFLDGLSHSALKSAIYIKDMKTERFAQIVVPQELQNANNVEQRKAYTDFAQDEGKDTSNEFKNRLTLAAMPVRIKIHGTFGAIVNFLNSVENYRQLLTVNDIEITRNPMEYPQLDCDFVLKIYSLEKLKDIKP